jgi:hypothetical protein
MKRSELIQLAKNVIKGGSCQFSDTTLTHEQMKATLLEELKVLAPDYYSFQQNKYLVFEILTEMVDPILPRKINDIVGRFAETIEYGQNQKPVFKKRVGRQRAKSFITKVGLAGVYETFRLDTTTYDVPTTAIGGAANVSLERMLDGHEDLVELSDIVLEGIEEIIYKEIWTALIALIGTLPAANKYSGNAFNSTEMRKIITTVKAYGDNATIFCFPEFAQTIMPDVNFIGDADKSDMRDIGYIGRFAGADVVVLPQSFILEDNAEKVFDPSMAIIVPSGGAASDKIVKVAFEGQTIFDDYKEKDWSTTFQAYKKIGVAIHSANHIGMYENTSLAI